MPKQPKILIFVDWYEPGFKAGGPIRSVANFVDYFKNVFDIYIITSDSDSGDKESYVDIKSNIWIRQHGFSIFYAIPKYLTFRRVNNMIVDINPNWIYVNSMFSWHYSILPVLIKYFFYGKTRLLLAPRGMLKKTALKFKTTKKYIFLNFYKLLNIPGCIVFQATSFEEVLEIKHIFGRNSEAILLPNLGWRQNEFVPIENKNTGQLALIFVGRIHPIKNLLILLELLGEIKDHKISLSVVGKIDDEIYWQQCKAVIKKFNLSVQFLGDIAHSGIEKIVIQHHLFVLLTQGENFGHAIYESLACGRPVLISDCTPWKNLHDFHAGWAIDLSKRTEIKQVIERAAQMNNEQMNILARGAWMYCHNYREKSSVDSDLYLKLFNT